MASRRGKFNDADLRRIVNRDGPERRGRTDPTGPARKQRLFYVISVKICARPHTYTQTHTHTRTHTHVHAHTHTLVRARRKRQKVTFRWTYRLLNLLSFLETAALLFHSPNATNTT